ncbi:MAG: AAA family ATPase, partial [Bacteroidales bacterium]
VLDDGRMTDNKGRTADFKNAILIMTSNTGSAIIQENLSRLTDKNREETLEKTKGEVLEVLKASVRPEFLNRIDEIIMFHPLTTDNIRDILKMQMEGVKEKVADMGIELQFTEYAIKYLTQKGYDPAYGARPVKRILQRELVNELAKALLKGSINKDKPVIVDNFEDNLVFRN